uniref:BHLH domain-containing protein n=1 Tax=Musa acuminata subsp. malaccensis TaxID=214687 RepID=A0A804IVC6_MUSAM|nr:PREDICTED: transcription factor bHLH18-like [Musa acuminata subsp. malaccensis]XP_018680476.1 PREDICTED: transcription factor bHLH18-like [Musa acuminata subsp. malaccensis]
MDTPWNNWFTQSGMDESNLLRQWEIASPNQDIPQAAPAPGRGLIPQSLSSESHTSPPFRPVSSSPGFVAGSSMSQEIISWDFSPGAGKMDPGGSSLPSLLLPKPSPQSDSVPGRAVKMKEGIRVCAPGGSKQRHGTLLQRATLSQAQEHIIAERNRREKLNQKFIALSAIIPGLKKADKASILGDAVRYLKELQGRVKALEDQNMERTVESVVLVTKAQLSADDDGGSSSDENFDGQPWQKPFPEIEAKVSGKMVLVRIHCENRKGVLVKILSEIEHLNLTITNTNVMPFLGSSINITVTAQIEEKFSMTAKDLVRKLKSALT